MLKVTPEEYAVSDAESFTSVRHPPCPCAFWSVGTGVGRVCERHVDVLMWHSVRTGRQRRKWGQRMNRNNWWCLTLARSHSLLPLNFLCFVCSSSASQMSTFDITAVTRNYSVEFEFHDCINLKLSLCHFFLSKCIAFGLIIQAAKKRPLEGSICLLFTSEERHSLSQEGWSFQMHLLSVSLYLFKHFFSYWFANSMQLCTLNVAIKLFLVCLVPYWAHVKNTHHVAAIGSDRWTWLKMNH